MTFNYIPSKKKIQVSEDDLVPIQKNIENISAQLDNWAKQIQLQWEQLVRDADNILLGIKNTQKEIELNVLITALQYAITAAEKNSWRHLENRKQ